MLHTPHPYFLQFSDNFGIRWYGLSYLVGFLIGALFIGYLSRRQRTVFPWWEIRRFLAYLIFGSILGGRIGYAALYRPSLFFQWDLSAPFWDLLKIWKGGMSLHGGIVGILLASLLFTWGRDLNWLHLLDLSTVGGSVGIFFGRIANFLNGELFGRPTAMPWGMRFPTEILSWLHHEPQQLLQLKPLAQRLAVSENSWSNLVQSAPLSSASFNELHEHLKLLLQLAAGKDAEVLRALSSLLPLRHPSQIYAAFFEGACVLFVVLCYWRNARQPGKVAAVWLGSYSLARFTVEFFRSPDPQIGLVLSLSRGQWLSLLGLTVSIILFFSLGKLRKPAMGGWGP